MKTENDVPRCLRNKNHFMLENVIVKFPSDIFHINHSHESKKSWRKFSVER